MVKSHNLPAGTHDSARKFIMIENMIQLRLQTIRNPFWLSLNNCLILQKILNTFTQVVKAKSLMFAFNLSYVSSHITITYNIHPMEMICEYQ